MKKTTILIGVSLLVSNLYGGFDFGGSDGGCEGGSGDFQQQINHYGGDYENAITVGTIPTDLKDVYISLKSDEDVDIRLYDANGEKIVHWPYGKLSGGGKDSTSYNGVTVEYSGYNGDGTGLGHEYIKISGTTQNDFVMKAFGYKAGYAEVDYSWAGKENCSESSNASGLGTFQQQIKAGHLNTVTIDGYIPKGINNLYVKVQSSKDIDIQLFDKNNGKALVGWGVGALIGENHDKDDTTYENMKIEYSGYNGEMSESWYSSILDYFSSTSLKGNEYIKVTGLTTKDLTMKVFGYEEGYATVDYYWGDDMHDVFYVVNKNSTQSKSTKYNKLYISDILSVISKLVTMDNLKKANNIKNILEEAKKWDDLVDEVESTDNDRDAVLSVLRFILNNNNILGGEISDKSFDILKSYSTGVQQNLINMGLGLPSFYLEFEEEGFFWNSSSSDVKNIKLHQVSRLIYPTDLSSKNSYYETDLDNPRQYEGKKMGGWSSYYSFKDSSGLNQVESGLYLVEFEWKEKIYYKSVFVQPKVEAYDSVLLPN